MERRFVERVRRALEPRVEHGELKRRSENGGKTLRTTGRVYSVQWDQTFQTNSKLLYSKSFIERRDIGNGWKGILRKSGEEDDYNVFVYYEGRCRIGDVVVSKFTASGDLLLSDFAFKLCGGKEEENNQMFFGMDGWIYLRCVDEESVRFASQLFQQKVFGIRRWDVMLGECIGNETREIYFYDGSNSRHIRICKIFFFHQKVISYLNVKSLCEQAELCKCCLKSNAVIRVFDDPILPAGRKDVCKRCFGLLFIERDGKLRYDGVRYEELDQ